MRRRELNKRVFALSLGALLLALCPDTEAQQPKKFPLIGYVTGSGGATPESRFEAFKHGLRELGYIDGKNIRIEYRYAEGKLDRIPSLVAELINLKVNVLVLPLSTAVRAAKQLTKTTPSDDNYG